MTAIDKTKYYFQNSVPEHQSPQLNGSIAIDFDELNSKLNISWPKTSDTDTVDSLITYEIQYLASSDWMAVGNATGTTKIVNPGDSLDINVRAKDNFENYSSILTTDWAYPPVDFYINQTETDGWSYDFGEKNPNCPFCADSASLQSIVPRENFQFDKVVLKLKQNLASDWSTPRLSVYSDNSNLPDFSNKLGESTIFDYNPDQNSERTFSFNTPISLIQNNKYWLVLDIAEYSDYRGFIRNRWNNAIYAGSDSYAFGQSGFGPSSACNGGFCQSFIFPYSNSNIDWHMKIGLKQ